MVQQSIQAGIPFRAVVADSFYGEDRTFRKGLEQLGVGYVLALKPSFAWWHQRGEIGSPQDAALAATWAGPQQAGDWVRVERLFHDGHTEDWWALEVVAGPFGPERPVRSIVVTTDPATLPALTTWYLITNLPASGSQQAASSALAAANLVELVRLSALRSWVEQSYKQVKHTLGWAQYQVRSDTAIRRHWALVCCAFTFCWWQATVPQNVDVPQRPAVAAQFAMPSAQKKHRTDPSSTLNLAACTPSSQSLARTLHHAQALLASIFALAPAAALAPTV